MGFEQDVRTAELITSFGLSEGGTLGSLSESSFGWYGHIWSDWTYWRISNNNSRPTVHRSNSQVKDLCGWVGQNFSGIGGNVMNWSWWFGTFDLHHDKIRCNSCDYGSLCAVTWDRAATFLHLKQIFHLQVLHGYCRKFEATRVLRLIIQFVAELSCFRFNVTSRMAWWTAGSTWCWTSCILLISGTANRPFEVL
jgi:hypothetical protein